MVSLDFPIPPHLHTPLFMPPACAAARSARPREASEHERGAGHRASRGDFAHALCSAHGASRGRSDDRHRAFRSAHVRKSARTHARTRRGRGVTGGSPASFPLRILARCACDVDLDAAGPSGAGQSSSGETSTPATHAPARRVIGTTADGEYTPVTIPPDDDPPATATSASPATHSATPTAGSSAHVVLPDVSHICRTPRCVRRSTDTEHGNHTLCCDRCSYTDGRFHTAVCDAADYNLTASSSSTVSTPVGTTDRNDFIPGWHNYKSEDNKLHPFSDVTQYPKVPSHAGVIPL